MTDAFPLPFDGAISRYLVEGAPEEIRAAIEAGRKRDIIPPGFAYDRWMKRAEYEERMRALQVELVKLKVWIAATGSRLVVVFGGRDTAGKSGAIRRVTENLNPRDARIMALGKPDERERSQWYFQRYVEQLRRMLARERHPHKQWKLSAIDVEGLGRWEAYTQAIAGLFARSHFDFAPWTVIRGGDKYRARIAAIQRLLTAFDYDRKDAGVVGAPDPRIMGGPALWPRG